MKFTDQTGESFETEHPARRIVSLVPSQTELLAHLELHTEIVGITKFCVLPEEWFSTKSRIGGTKTINLDKLRSLEPDLILANKEENDRQQVEALKKEFPVWTSDIVRPEHALDMIKSVGQLTNREQKAASLADQIARGLSAMPTYPAHSGLYLVWDDPIMVAGSDTFIHSMMSKAGFENLIAEPRYPEYDVRAEDCPDVVLLPTEPYPFGEKHLAQYQERFPQSKIILVDGQMFSWYGSRMLQFPAYIGELRKALEKLEP